MINRNLKHIFTILVIITVLVTISGTASANPNSPQADPIYVDTTEDHYEVTPDGDCSLREAITTINDGSAFGGCPYPTGATNIELATGATYILMIDGAGEDLNTTGDLDIGADMTIQGMNSTVTAWYLTDRVLDVHSGTVVVINDLTIQDGSTVDFHGGGVFNEGDLTLNDSTVQYNTVTGLGSGGGIFSYNNSLTLNRSFVYANEASAASGGGITIMGGDFICDQSTILFNAAAMTGGGLYIYNVADHYYARITRCEIRGNTAAYGGGLHNAGATLIENSIFDSNVASGYGGNIYNAHISYGPAPDLAIAGTVIASGRAAEGGGVQNETPAYVSIKYSTISYNQAQAGNGGGVFNYGEEGTGAFTIDHTTIADNTSTLPGSAIGMGAAGALHPLRIVIANSIISGISTPEIPLCNTWVDTTSYANLETANTCNLYTSLGNYVDTPAYFASELGDNGSKYVIGVFLYPTFTYALLPTSLAVDHADCALYTEDQRGYPLLVDGNGDGNEQCDMGSYELQRFSFLPFLKKP